MSAALSEREVQLARWREARQRMLTPPPPPPEPAAPTRTILCEVKRPPLRALYPRPIGPEKWPDVWDGKPRTMSSYVAFLMIVRQVCNRYGVTETDLMSHRRSKTIARPRQIAMYRCKRETLWSTIEIGRRIGGRDHTTVLHAVRKIGALIDAGDVVL